MVEVAQVDQEGDGLVVLLRFGGADQGVDALPGALAVPGERVQVPGPGECGSPVAGRAFAGAAFGGQPLTFCAVAVGVGPELGDGPADVTLVGPGRCGDEPAAQFGADVDVALDDAEQQGLLVGVIRARVDSARTAARALASSGRSTARNS